MPKDHKPRSPVSHHSANFPHLPASVEESYRRKCKQIKKRIVEIENSNDSLTSRIQRARRAIQRMRLERAFLLQQLEVRTDVRVDDSEGSPSPPPTPSQKPLRMKRTRKEALPAESPARHNSASPLRQTPDAYPFVLQNAKTGKGQLPSRSRGGPKRPPNAYMIFCERERDAIRERDSGKEDFDMHKALAQAWRDLKSEGQKPYFEEYEKYMEQYKSKLDARNDLRSTLASSVNTQKGAMSTAPSAPQAPHYDTAQSPAPGSANEDVEDHTNNRSDSALTSTNRA